MGEPSGSTPPSQDASEPLLTVQRGHSGPWPPSPSLTQSRVAELLGSSGWEGTGGYVGALGAWALRTRNLKQILLPQKPGLTQLDPFQEQSPPHLWSPAPPSFSERSRPPSDRSSSTQPSGSGQAPTCSVRSGPVAATGRPGLMKAPPPTSLPGPVLSLLLPLALHPSNRLPRTLL